MTQTPDTQPLSDQEIASVRQNLNLLRSQIQAGRVDGTFLTRQIEKMVDVVERVDAERRQRRREGRFKALYDVSRLLGESLDVQTVLQQVMDSIIQLTSAERGFLMLRNDDGHLEVKVARNLDQQTLSSDKFKYSRTIVNEVLDSGQPIVTTNAVEDPRFAGQASIIGQALRSIMATPLRARGNVIGVVYVDNGAIAGLFDQDDLAALDTFASQAAVAIDNARLFSATDQELSRRVEEMTQLRRIDLLLNETLESDRAMLYTLEWACRVSGADTGHLGLVEGDPPQVRTVHHYGQSDPTETALDLDSVYPAALETAYSAEKRIVQGADGSTVMLVPVKREHQCIGVVILKRQGAFSDAEQDMVDRVVTRAAVAIENARLYAAVKAADRAKSEFIGIVAHDLKVPMTSILGYAELTLLQGGLAERQAEFQQKIRDTVRRMEMLVSDLADISRIEGGHFYMNETVVQVGDVIQAVRDGTMTQIMARSHTYAENIQPSLPPMYVDYYRLLQVLTNLVSNAYKYTPDGGKITLSACQDDSRRIVFSVEDTGIGLNREQIAQLGTKFWRADDTYTRSQPGTGLGFAITRSLVEQMGSQIVVESEPGKGSKFSFSVAAASS